MISNLNNKPLINKVEKSTLKLLTNTKNRSSATSNKNHSRTIYKIVKNENCSEQFSNNALWQNETELKVYEHYVEIHTPAQYYPNLLPPNREVDDITRFSSQSRLRMLKLLAKINLNAYEDIYFASITYSKSFPTNPKLIKRYFKNFQERLKYYLPQVKFVWRLEIQKRGAPHYHLILLFPKKIKGNGKDKLKRLFNKIWVEFLKQNDEWSFKYGAKIQAMYNYKQLFYYVSKYAAKEEEINTEKYTGRRWGYSDFIVLSKPLITITEKNFIEEFKNIVLKYLKNRGNLSKQFEDYFLTSPTLTIFLDLSTACELLENIKSLSP